MKTCLLHLAIAFLGAASGFANTLTTTFAGGNGRVGFMFDVAADQALTIDAFQFATFLESPAGSVEIYTKSGTHEGSEGTPAEWTLLGTVAYAASAALTPKAPVALPTPISLLAGERRAFYLRETDGRNLAYTDGDGVGTLEAADGNLRIFEGTGIGGTFGAPLADRIPNIAIHYTPADPFLLTTGFLGGNNGKGIMFDVVAKSSLSLVSLQLAPSAGFPGLRTFDVYTRSGTHVGAEGNAAAWTLIRRVSFHSDGNRTPFEVELPRPIAMAKGSTRGFYIIALSGGVLSYSNGGPEGVGNVEASDAHLTILKGRHHTDLFTPTEFERVPNVAFRYRNRDRAAPRLTIVGPRRIRATKPRATIYGIATDDVRVAHVRATYRRATPRGLGKKTNKRVVPRASGLFKLNLKLAPGRNPVVFRAFDGDGRSSAPARVTVIR